MRISHGQAIESLAAQLEVRPWFVSAIKEGDEVGQVLPGQGRYRESGAVGETPSKWSDAE